MAPLYLALGILAAAALSIGFTLWVYLRLTEELAKIRRQAREQSDQPPSPAPRAVAPGMNYTRRTQIVRLSRQGESAAAIAEMLGAPIGEVELTLKLAKLTPKVVEIGA
jgi:DNA-binding NarL/FixJ family response regulator